MSRLFLWKKKDGRFLYLLFFRVVLLELFGLTKPTPPPKRETPFFIQVHGKDFPVTIHIENRYNSRVSVNAKEINIRISSRLSKAEQKKQADHFLKWAKEKLDGKPQLMEELPQRNYADGEILQIGGQVFFIRIISQAKPKSSARISGQQLVIHLAAGLHEEARKNTLSYLISRCLCKFFQPVIDKRLRQLNEQYIQRPLYQVKLKYNTTNWGSCSTQGNINISLRLLFAPAEVVDYVLIHELVHLIHHNHSAAFWKKVSSIMPDYRTCEAHLKAFHLKYYL